MEKTYTLLAIGVFLCYLLVGMFALYLRWLDWYLNGKDLLSLKKTLLGRVLIPNEVSVDQFSTLRAKFSDMHRASKRVLYPIMIFMGFVQLFDVVMGKIRPVPLFFDLVIALLGSGMLIIMALIIYLADIHLRRLSALISPQQESKDGRWET